MLMFHRALAGGNSSIPPSVVAPALDAPTMTSDGANITFSGGSGYSTLIPQYSSNGGTTWTSISNDNTSPLTFTGLAAGNYSFRALADGSTSYASNVVTGTVAAAGAALFSDNFSSGDFSHTQNGISWGSQTSVTVSSGAAQFSYTGGASGTDATSELRLQNILSGGSYINEAWAKFDLTVPSNFTHRADSPSNNKLFAIWMDDYSALGTGPTVVWESWDNGANGSDLGVHWSEGANTGGGIHIQLTPFISVPSDRGRTMTVVFRVKEATYRATPINPSSDPYLTSDGVIEMWRKWSGDSVWTKFHTVTNANIRRGSGASGWNNLYLMGWSDSGYAATTVFTVDNFELAQSNIWGVA